MGRQIIVSSCHEDYLKKLSKKCSAGLLIGKITEGKDYVTRVVQCPDQITDGVAEEWATVGDIDTHWLAGHGSSIAPSLPGGLDVIGIFVKAPAGKANEINDKLKVMLYQTYRLVFKVRKRTCDHFDGTVEESLYWSSIHMDSKTGIVVHCRQYDVRDHKDTGKPIEWKHQTQDTVWDCVNCKININQTVIINGVPSSSDRGDQFISAVGRWCDKISAAHVSFSNQIKMNSEILNPHSAPAGKSKKKKAAPKSPQERIYSCRILVSPNSKCSSRPDSTEPNRDSIKISGSVSGTAYILPNTTVGEAVHALKFDLIQSVYQRCNILVEDLNELGNDVPETVPWESLPKRVYFGDCLENQGDRILFSEYLMPDEPAEDLCERIKDNFDMDVSVEKLALESQSERFHVGGPEQPSKEKEDIREISEKKLFGTRSVVGIVVASVVAAIGWAFARMGLESD